MPKQATEEGQLRIVKYFRYCQQNQQIRSLNFRFSSSVNLSIDLERSIANLSTYSVIR